MSPRWIAVSAGAGIVTLAFGLTLLDAWAEGQGGRIPDLALDFLDRLLMLGAAVAAMALIQGLFRLERRTEALTQDLSRAAEEGRAWRAQSRRFLNGLSRCIEAQFDAWQLTPAEADVAGLLLKGATVREIALLRRTSEATIRQQAGNVYRKSGLGSRAELSAFFLEDLFNLGEAAFAEPAERSPDRYDA